MEDVKDISVGHKVFVDIRPLSEAQYKDCLSVFKEAGVEVSPEMYSYAKSFSWKYLYVNSLSASEEDAYLVLTNTLYQDSIEVSYGGLVETSSEVKHTPSKVPHLAEIKAYFADSLVQLTPWYKWEYSDDRGVTWRSALKPLEFDPSTLYRRKTFSKRYKCSGRTLVHSLENDISPDVTYDVYIEEVVS